MENPSNVLKNIIRQKKPYQVDTALECDSLLHHILLTQESEPPPKK